MAVDRPQSNAAARPVFSVKHVTLPAGPLRYEGGEFVIGNKSMTLGGIDNLRTKLDLAINDAGRVTLAVPQGSFVLGPRTNEADPSGRPDTAFVPEEGDALCSPTAKA